MENETPFISQHEKMNKASEKFKDDSMAPMHTAEHILNGTMVKMFGCLRAQTSHIERKKSKCDYKLPRQLSAIEVQTIEDKVNEIIAADMPVTFEITEFGKLEEGRFDLSRLPKDASSTVRIVKIGNYDECLCVGTHVRHTAEIGHFRISSTRYENGMQRIVFRLDNNSAESSL